ncbi:MAG: CotH kinase family protein, partial [Chitinophagales bacterium]
MKLKFKIFGLLFFAIALTKAQTVPYSILFDDNQLNSISVNIDPDSLDQLFDDLENEYEYQAQFVYSHTGGIDTLENIGFRLRGNTSLTSAKKSYKISFNTYNSGRKYMGAEKLNLIGNHNDPTMSREKIYFDVYNSWGLPVRRVAFVKFFINGEYYGLYTLTEEYDEIFLKDRFGESTGNLYKCLYGSNLDYNGPGAAAYDSYELQNNEQQNDYSDLIELCDVLNNTPIADLPCALEKIFNVDHFLKIYALDISTGHWDNYGANQNNFFLYHNQFTGQFEFMSYDCDNTLGIDWLGIDWADRDIYDWNFNDRPMVERLLDIDEYKNRLSYYINELSSTLLDPAVMDPHIDSISDFIADAAFDDIYRTYDYGYTYADFLNGFNTDDIDGHTPYGIKNFIELRVENNFDQVDLNPFSPVLIENKHVPDLPETGDDVIITTKAFDDNSISVVKLFYGENGFDYTEVNMFDDGIHNDSLGGDGIYGVTVPTTTSIAFLFHYFEATDDDGNISRYPLCDNFSFHVGYIDPEIVINEFMAVNDTTIV